ncbi:CAP domain-containing protein [Candidatus Saccharibacteria bacterium]|nr:CAP domain-containing protein [Candidatus Saccharibacteria bacterium]
MAKIKSGTTDRHRTKPSNVHKHAFEKVYWPYIPIVLVITLLLSIGVQSGNLTSFARHPAGRVLAYSNSMTIGSLLADTNAARSANGVASLALNNRLDAAAQANADDMAARDYWSHYTPDGSPPWIWVSGQSYSYQKLGQNLATGFDDEQSTIDGWMASPPHRENLLDPSFKEVGFGYANVPNYTAAGGGPMTVVVAFYGQPQVLSATATAPTAAAPKTKTPTPASTPAATASPQPQPAQTQPTSQSTPAPEPTKQPATTTTTKENLTPVVKSSRLQLAVGNSTLTTALTTASIIGAIVIAAWWLRRHMRLAHRYLLKGERYFVGHPLTDIGLLVIACLLFILSQTAGLTL